MGQSRICIARRWRWPKVMLVLFILEFPLTVAALTLFGVADPDTYRTKLWQDGADHGFNSAPDERLYALANYRPYTTPVVWSQYNTDFNVVISVLSMFLLLVKVVVYVMHGFFPILSVIVHSVLIAIYAYSIHNQSTPDLTDPTRSSPGLPWYLSKGCSYAVPANYSYCMQARACFAITIVLLALFSAYFIYAILNLMPTPEEKEERRAAIELHKVEKLTPAGMTKEEQREYNRQLFLNLPKTPSTPFGKDRFPMTPRTVAFQQLSGEQPTSPVGNTLMNTIRNAGPSRKLPFREHYTELDDR